MSVVGLLLAIGGAFLTRSADAAQVLLVSGALSVYAGLLVNWHTAVQRVSGAPTVWFTAVVPVIVAVSATATEAINAYWLVFDTSAVLLVPIPVALVVTLAGAQRAGRRWRAGLLAWSMVLFHVGLSVGALAGIPFGTFGDITRSDELLAGGAVLPLVAMSVALPFAPRTPWTTRLAGPVLVAAIVPAALVTGTPVAGLAVIAALSVTIVNVGSTPGPGAEEEIR